MLVALSPIFMITSIPVTDVPLAVPSIVPATYLDSMSDTGTNWKLEDCVAGLRVGGFRSRLHSLPNKCL